MSKKPSMQNQQQGYYESLSHGLEKAAMAAKYLDGSDNAKGAMQLALDTEKTKQLEVE
jgi:hypothetical protein